MVTLKIASEIYDRISKREVRSAATSWLAYLLQATIIRDVVSTPSLARWLALVLLCEIINLGISHKIKTHLANLAIAGIYTRCLTLTLFFSGVCWGLSALLPGLESDPIKYVSNFFILIVVSVFSIYNLSLHWEKLMSFSLGLMLPIFIQNVGQADQFSFLICLASATTLIGVQLYGYWNRQIEHNEIVHRLEVQRLANSLDLKNRELQQALDSLAEVASQDPLTKCLNRRALTERYNESKRTLPDASSGMGLLILDADHFKAINDQRGHEIGDLVLVNLAEKVKSCLRAGDHVGRWGGEEFVCLLPNVTEGCMLELAEQIRIAIAEMKIDAGTDTFNITVSIGATSAIVHASLEKAVAQADIALYRAKQSGRNRVCLA